MSIVIAYLGLVGLAVLLDRLVATLEVERSTVRPPPARHRGGRRRRARPDLTRLVARPVVHRRGPSGRRTGRPADGAGAAGRGPGLRAAPDGFPVRPSRRRRCRSTGCSGPGRRTPTALEYSAGAMQGRGGDWQRSWVLQPVEQMLPGVAAAGFDGVYLDRRSEDGGGATSGTAPAASLAARHPRRARPASCPTAILEPRVVRPAAAARRAGRASWAADRVEALGAAVRRPIGVVLRRRGRPVRREPTVARLLRADSSITPARRAGRRRGEPSGPATDPVRVRFD